MISFNNLDRGQLLSSVLSRLSIFPPSINVKTFCQNLTTQFSPLHLRLKQTSRSLFNPHSSRKSYNFRCNKSQLALYSKPEAISQRASHQEVYQWNLEQGILFNLNSNREFIKQIKLVLVRVLFNKWKTHIPQIWLAILIGLRRLVTLISFLISWGLVREAERLPFRGRGRVWIWTSCLFWTIATRSVKTMTYLYHPKIIILVIRQLRTSILIIPIKINM